MLKGFKTIGFSIATVLIGALEQFDYSLVPEGYEGFALMAVGALVAVLRWVTTTPIFQRL